MCRLQNIAMCDYQGSVTSGQTDAGQSDPSVPLSFAGDKKLLLLCLFRHILRTFLDKNEKIINHHIAGGTRKSDPRVQDLLHP